ncbi:hypothetical protein ACFPRL_16210 [Pseudoclavibacter helvolus]
MRCSLLADDLRPRIHELCLLDGAVPAELPGQSCERRTGSDRVSTESERLGEISSLGVLGFRGQSAPQGRRLPTEDLFETRVDLRALTHRTSLLIGLARLDSAGADANDL